jgi:hypothetical protein
MRVGLGHRSCLPDSGSGDAQQILAGLAVKHGGEFIRVDGMAEALDAVDEDDGDVVAVLFEEVLVLGDIDFLDEHRYVRADDFLGHFNRGLAEVAAGFGHDGDFVHERSFAYDAGLYASPDRAVQADLWSSLSMNVMIRPHFKFNWRKEPDVTQPPSPNLLEYAKSPDGIREIAKRQRALLLCILGNILLYLLLLATRDRIPLMAALLIVGALFAVEITAMVYVFLLSTKLYGMGVGILMGILTLVPCLGLLILLVVNGRATTALQASGIKVGLLGAKLPPGY